MSAPSVSRLTLIVLAASVLSALPAMAASQARIVRLSDVQGSVQIDKNTGIGFEKAFINLPITQGTKLQTGDTGRAEIEFEDGSSMRLAPKTSVDFSTLNVSDSGAHISEVNLAEGMAYVNWLAKNGDELTVNFAREKLALDHPAHFRVDASPEVANLAVFKGDLQLDGPAGQVKLEKKKTATFDVAQNDKYTIQNKVQEAALDSWDKEASSYHDQYAKNNNTSPYGYGLSDLNYYGSYTNVPGYGMMWQPYFTGVGWDPFVDGAWGFYPGYGYMFASAYPWGWLPYRYGNWNFVPGSGWMWQPGAWNNWLTVPRYTPTTATRVSALTPPPTGTVRTVPVGRLGVSPTSTSSRMVVNSGSAGLGIPRGSVRNLDHVNHQVVKTGSAQVKPAPQFSPNAPQRTASQTQGAASQPHGNASQRNPGMAPSRAPMNSAPPMRSSAPPARSSAPAGPHR
jgi:FecR protein